MGLFDNITKSITSALTSDIDALRKSANDVPDISFQDDDNKGDIGTAHITDPYYDNVSQGTYIYKRKPTRLSHRMLKETSMRDWLVSSILQARADTLLRFGRAQQKGNLFDTGFVVNRKDGADLTKEDNEVIHNIQEFIYNCGRTDNVPQQDRTTFSEFLKLASRDALVFGHVAIEKVLTRNGGLHRFRIVPAEAMYLVDPKAARKTIQDALATAKKLQQQNEEQSDNNPRREQAFNNADVDYFKYVQMSNDDAVLAAFGDEDMIWMNANPQNFADSRGYGQSILELAILTITNNLQLDNYTANFFTHGFAAKGILHLKGTVTQQQLTAFRRQFYNTISGHDNAWRTPILAGLEDVSFVPLAGNSKEMEYLNYSDRLMRSICSQFQIDPVEVGLDYLATTGKAAGPQSNEDKVEYSRERGLYPLFIMFEDIINLHVIPAIDPQFAETYQFKFVGYTDETAQTVAALNQALMTTSSSQNDLLKSVGKERIDHPIADMPLNSTFIELANSMLTKGEMRELFLGDKEAAGKRELAYLGNDPMFANWQQFLLTADAQKAQMEQQAAQMEAEQQQQQAEQQSQEAQAQAEQQQGDHDRGMAETQDKREQEKHDAEMAEVKSRHHHAVKQESLKEIAKDNGFATKAEHVDGQTLPNPISSDLADEKE